MHILPAFVFLHSGTYKPQLEDISHWIAEYLHAESTSSLSWESFSRFPDLLVITAFSPSYRLLQRSNHTRTTRRSGKIWQPLKPAPLPQLCTPETHHHIADPISPLSLLHIIFLLRFSSISPQTFSFFSFYPPSETWCSFSMKLLDSASLTSFPSFQTVHPPLPCSSNRVS
jgi:hypothetical protein